MTIEGTWRITYMDLWGPDAIDLLGPGFFQFDGERGGRFRFIAVEGWMDCRHRLEQGRPVVEFSWDGFDDRDPANGRGWARVLADGSLDGRIYFHQGDESGFRAERAEPEIVEEGAGRPRPRGRGKRR